MLVYLVLKKKYRTGGGYLPFPYCFNRVLHGALTNSILSSVAYIDGFGVQCFKYKLVCWYSISCAPPCPAIVWDSPCPSSVYLIAHTTTTVIQHTHCKYYPYHWIQHTCSTLVPSINYWRCNPSELPSYPFSQFWHRMYDIKEVITSYSFFR